MDKNAQSLITLLSPKLNELGYELVYLEAQTARQKVLRLFIDKPDGITLEDCTRVSRALDEPLEQWPEVAKIFNGAYELEVSSPGVDRPLRQLQDYERFAGKEVRIQVYRPLTAEELESERYKSKNPKQKNFLGTLRGIRGEKVVLGVVQTGNSGEEVAIPLALIAKANLEPKFELMERE